GVPPRGRAGLGDGGLALGLERSACAVGTPGKEVHRVPEVSRGPLVSNGLALVVGLFRRRRGGLRGVRCRDRVGRRLFRCDRRRRFWGGGRGGPRRRFRGGGRQRRGGGARGWLRAGGLGGRRLRDDGHHRRGCAARGGV